ncbi:MAG: hypothetical protein CMJ64_10075 [Planctomycetaceae bacterium]|nr:hypothetical protein [Planctomycetaceae bacterium]
MSLLTPLYMLGLAGIALPILFHLIRRTPRGRQTFSSLMFLAPSPPRLTRRSRIEQWLLLLLRAAALMLLALAFARPFLREAANLSLSGTRGRRVAILLDTSASMRRGDVWQQAIAKVRETIDSLEAADEVALFTFADEVRTIVDFNQQPDAQRKQQPQLILDQLSELAPGWSHTDLGNALASVAGILSANADEDDAGDALQLIVISDVQAGADLKALQAYEWPTEVAVSIDVARPSDPSNASLRVLAVDEETEGDDELRVRVSNAADSTAEQFHVHWAGQEQTDGDVPIYVPAGQSRVIRIAPPDAGIPSDHLVLKGDADDFDNDYYVVPLEQDQVDVAYIGSDKLDDPDGLLYYLNLAFAETPERKVEITKQTSEDLAFVSGAETPPRMVVVNAALSPDGFKAADDHLRRGGFVLAVPTSSEAAVALASYSEELDYVPSKPRTREDGYLMLADIDFAHPLFATFATPRYSDFTKIHFWNHQRFAIRDEEALRLVARFDNGDPAMWEQPVGDGKLFVLTSGWHPDDSQLALSSKFVPLLNTLLDQAAGAPIHLPSFKVGESVPLPKHDGTVTVTKPDGATLPLDAGSESFRQTDQPGIYSATLDNADFRFAVNLTSLEANTSPMDVEQLEQRGVQLGEHASQTEEAKRKRQLRDVELEAQQQVWRWLIVGVLGALGIETWLAGRRARVDLVSRARPETTERPELL